MCKTWKSVDGFDGLYEVSSNGEVRSKDRIVVYKTSKQSPKGHRGVHKGRVLKPDNVHGYKRVVLSKGDSQSKRMVHRLVAQAFIPNPEDKPNVNHIDGDKTNNNVENLEWVTSGENTRHAYNTGLIPETRRRVLTKEDVIKIRDEYSKGDTSYSKLSEKYGVNRSTIFKIIKKQTWKNV